MWPNPHRNCTYEFQKISTVEYRDVELYVSVKNLIFLYSLGNQVIQMPLDLVYRIVLKQVYGLLNKNGKNTTKRAKSKVNKYTGYYNYNHATDRLKKYWARYLCFKTSFFKSVSLKNVSSLKTQHFDLIFNSKHLEFPCKNKWRYTKIFYLLVLSEVDVVHGEYMFYRIDVTELFPYSLKNTR